MEAANLGEAGRVELARAVMDVLEDWGVSSKQRLALLGLPQDTRPRVLNRYRSGTPLPDDAALLIRVSRILSIQSAAQSLFPHCVPAATAWITSETPLFNNRSPLDVMLSSGLEGMETVLERLDSSGAWG